MEFDSDVTGILIFENNCGGYSENVVIHGGGYSVIVDMITQTTSYLDGSNAGIVNPQEGVRWKPSKWIGFVGINGFKQELEKSKQPGYKPIELDEPDDDVPEVAS